MQKRDFLLERIEGGSVKDQGETVMTNLPFLENEFVHVLFCCEFISLRIPFLKGSFVIQLTLLLSN